MDWARCRFEGLPRGLWYVYGGSKPSGGHPASAARGGEWWYADDSDLPGLLDCDVIGSWQTYLYFDGEPLYPFGHGLSYSSFGYNELSGVRDGGQIKVSFTVATRAARSRMKSSGSTSAPSSHACPPASRSRQTP